jgi:signal peptidase I
VISRLFRRGGLVEVVLIVVVAIGFALVFQATVAKPYQIPSESMEPTLDVGQRVLVDRLAYRFGDPSIGDIVVFHPPAGAEGNRCQAFKPASEACPQSTPGVDSSINYIKRIVAGPGDTLKIVNGHPVVNGVTANEPFIRPCAGGGECNLPRPITIPPDHYFVMGDNRGDSADSRYWGPIARSSIIGKAIFTYWPPNRVGTL